MRNTTKKKSLEEIIRNYRQRRLLRDERGGKKSENLLKEENRKNINIEGKQGELHKRLKESNEFFGRVGLSQSNIYFKICLHKFLAKSLTILRVIFKLIKRVCKANVDIFGEKK